jgi:hypothetical protein
MSDSNYFSVDKIDAAVKESHPTDGAPAVPDRNIGKLERRTSEA